MRSSFKKAIIIAICAVLVVSAVVPTLALIDSEVYNNINYSLGVKVNCYSGINNLQGTGTITLEFVSGVSHMPESDYYTRAYVKINYINAYSHLTDTDNCHSMTATAIRSKRQDKVVSSAEYEYWANYISVHTVTFS
ncbi:MAG: hypothetical protein J5544_05510 [Clostridia bacterium]|nr:hypothetical protein [Clostridia bacterium]